MKNYSRRRPSAIGSRPVDNRRSIGSRRSEGGPICGKLRRRPDVFLNQIQCRLGITDDVIAVTPAIAFLTEIVVVEGISAGAVGGHHQGAVLKGRCVMVFMRIHTCFHAILYFGSAFIRINGTRRIPLPGFLSRFRLFRVFRGYHGYQWKLSNILSTLTGGQRCRIPTYRFVRIATSK